MTDQIEIGTVPADEDCQQVGMPSYDRVAARAECERFREQLRMQFGHEPLGARLLIQSSIHEYGSYFEVVCRYEEGNQAALAYALKCEGEAWTTWK